MNKTLKYYFLVLTVPGLALITACSPEVGSEAWCDAMKEKPRGDWSANHIADFAQHCVLQ
jgi:hypothetical protein